jgi:hypothetical protein
MPTAPFLSPDRDAFAKTGRPKGGGTTHYIMPTSGGRMVDGTAIPSVNTDYYGAFRFETPVVVDRLACEVTTLQSGNLRMGLYMADGDLQPMGAPLADSGDISTNTTGVKTYTPSTPIILRRGSYLWVMNVSVASVAVRHWDSSPVFAESALGVSAFLTTMSVGRTYAAFPTPGTAWTTVTKSSTGFQNFVLLRLSTP